MTMERELSFENDAKFKDHLKSVLKKKGYEILLLQKDEFWRQKLITDWSHKP